jgi:hypothetical protein
MDTPAAAPQDPSPKSVRTRFLPFSEWLPVLAGVLSGIGLRLLFMGRPGGMYTPMMGAFIYFAPTLVGAITVYVAERRARRSWAYYVGAAALANVLFVIGTLAIMIEGLICVVIIMPLFAVLGAVGGLAMGAMCRLGRRPRRAIYSFAAVPLVFGAVETRLPAPQRVETIERVRHIAAPPPAIWREIWDVRDIRPDEVEQAWMYRIGVPLPVSGITQQTPQGLVRRITMGKNIHFDQVFVDWQPDRYVLWTYRFAEDSFPPAALDDHVKIGGHYFGLQTTSYTITPEGGGAQLKISMQYRLSTDFNWYADPVARLLMGNFEEVILAFYGRRAEMMHAVAHT